MKWTTFKMLERSSAAVKGIQRLTIRGLEIPVEIVKNLKLKPGDQVVVTIEKLG